MDNTIYETQRKFKIERTVNIDDETVILKVLGDIDMVKGTWKTNTPRTTLTLSSNPDQNKAVNEQLNSMQQEMMLHLETIRQNLANGDGDADDLFSGLPGYDKEDGAETEKEALRLPMPSHKKRKSLDAEYTDTDLLNTAL
jgi:hypothetical protein